LVAEESTGCEVDAKRLQHAWDWPAYKAKVGDNMLRAWQNHSSHSHGLH
jgi:hypothetical protein